MTNTALARKRICSCVLCLYDEDNDCFSIDSYASPRCRLSTLAARFLGEKPGAVCADIEHGRMLVAGRHGISSVRLETLRDGGAWLDEGCEGYHGFGDHLRNLSHMAIRADGRFLVNFTPYALNPKP